MKVVIGIVASLLVVVGLGASVVAVSAWYLLFGGSVRIAPTTTTGASVPQPTLNGVTPAGGVLPVSSNQPPRGVPPDQWQVMVEAARAASCAIDPTVLAAMAKTESGFGANMSTSSAGAFGYGQFTAPTWASQGAGGDPYDYHAALPAMARYLCNLGYSSDPVGALNTYGGCTSPACLGRTDYASLIQSTARGFAQAIGQLLGGSGSTPAAVDVAQEYVAAHVPYVFGGNSFAGIDCSGLVQQVYLQFGKQLPRTAADQFVATQRISQDQLQPGDLVFFANTYMPGVSHVGIYIGNGLQINAPDVGQTVSVQPVFTGYWGAHLAGFGRVV